VITFEHDYSIAERVFHLHIRGFAGGTPVVLEPAVEIPVDATVPEALEIIGNALTAVQIGIAKATLLRLEHRYTYNIGRELKS